MNLGVQDCCAPENKSREFDENFQLSIISILVSLTLPFRYRALS
jgi:hypothetical protein